MNRYCKIMLLSMGMCVGMSCLFGMNSKQKQQLEQEKSDHDEVISYRWNGYTENDDQPHMATRFWKWFTTNLWKKDDDLWHYCDEDEDQEWMITRVWEWLNDNVTLVDEADVEYISFDDRKQLATKDKQPSQLKKFWNCFYKNVAITDDEDPEDIGDHLQWYW